MAIACTNLTQGTKTTDATSAATASITPTANALVIATVISRRGDSGEPTEPTASGNGLTWVSLGSAYTDTGGASRKKVTWFRAMGSSPSAGAVTFSFSETQTSFTWAIDEFTGVDTSGTNGSGAIVQSVINNQDSSTGAATSNTATLAAFGSANNATYGSFAGDQSLTPVAVGSGFTQIADIEETVEGTTLVYTEFKTTNDTTVDVTYSSGNSNAIIGIEVKASVAGVTVKTLASLGVG